MKKTTRKIMSILIACVMVLGTLSAACLPVRAEEENSAAVPAETVREAEPEAAAPETAEAQPGETAPEAASAQSEEAVSDSSREDGPEASAAPETAETQPEETPAADRPQKTGTGGILYPAFRAEKTVDGITVCVSAGEGIFPEENSRAADVTVAASYTFDIKVLDQEGNEIQPADGRSVTVSFAAAEAADRNLEASVYHVADGEAEALNTVCEGNTVKAETDGFSYYTVEFTYGTLKYSLPGNGTVELKTVLDMEK